MSKKIRKKNLKTFLSEEEGKMTKKDILKLGAIVIFAAGILSRGIVKPEDARAGTAHGSHASHASHGSHSSGGNNGSVHLDSW